METATHVKSMIPELDFIEKTHTYTFMGKVIPSVTTILKETNCSGRGYEKSSPGTAAIRGTLVHRWAELTLDKEMGKERDDLEGLLKEMEGSGYLDSLRAYWNEVTVVAGWDILLTEGRFIGPLKSCPLYAGTADLILYDEEDHRLKVVDYKTGAQQPSHALQLCAYGLGVASITDFPLSKISLEAVYLGKDGTYIRKNFDFEAGSREEWLAVCRTFWWQKRNGLLGEEK